MGLLVWILCILIAVVVIFLIYLDQKSKLEPKPESEPESKHKQLKSINEEEKTYITIYEYVATRQVKKCAYCDGENAYGVKQCRICGNVIEN